MAGPKRVTEKQLAANRANAQRSTGPRTAEGRAHSRWNALKHGALAQAIVPAPLAAYESAEAFDALHRALRDELIPSSALEEIMVEIVATCYWRLARVYRAEAGAIAIRQGQAEATVFKQLGMPRPTKQSPLRTGTEVLRTVIETIPKLQYLAAGGEQNRLSLADWQALANTPERLAGLEEQLTLAGAEYEGLTAERAERSIPSIEHALQLARYEAHLERQLYRALATLERLQRRRLGDAVPPPLDVNLTISEEPDAS
ncbi:MAG: hypothetical protein ACYC5O_24260 [Anaerolineae bacterium]